MAMLCYTRSCERRCCYGADGATEVLVGELYAYLLLGRYVYWSGHNLTRVDR